ncbi:MULTISPECIES: RNA polymerase sigma factor [Asticcacaulis]|uniref:RNA polymerase sigma factor n=1 Tax=Asticcacaulis TaxID=76890 RepID=UPI001AEA10D5|nr:MULTISPECIES: sigma-70 family RNA polymerase sigma factor [Asticcacaulis]MBP2161473.1 RNA polymerase sigma-70 factor (ECF subfamily) [Asticcacaulis solisilvae]MDR6802518.1 RNA polymerase sigma-70 factor (ECF subfamily) [Asticcacaulis sp. BE141]
MVRVTDERALWLSRYVLMHEPALRAWLSKRRVPGLEVDDIVQETYARLSAVESVAGISNVRNYLFQIAYSVMVSHIRRSKVVSFQTVSNIEELGVMADLTPEDQVIGRDELHKLAEAVARLPGKVRDVFILRRVHGLGQRDVAKKLGLSESTVEKHMSRGIILLMSLFSGSGNDASRASRAWGNRLRKDDARSARRDSKPD